MTQNKAREIVTNMDLWTLQINGEKFVRTLWNSGWAKIVRKDGEIIGRVMMLDEEMIGLVMDNGLEKAINKFMSPVNLELLLEE